MARLVPLKSNFVPLFAAGADSLDVLELQRLGRSNPFAAGRSPLVIAQERGLDLLQFHHVLHGDAGTNSSDRRPIICLRALNAIQMDRFRSVVDREDGQALSSSRREWPWGSVAAGSGLRKKLVTSTRWRAGLPAMAPTTPLELERLLPATDGDRRARDLNRVEGSRDSLLLVGSSAMLHIDDIRINEEQLAPRIRKEVVRERRALQRTFPHLRLEGAVEGAEGRRDAQVELPAGAAVYVPRGMSYDLRPVAPKRESTHRRKDIRPTRIEGFTVPPWEASRLAERQGLADLRGEEEGQGPVAAAVVAWRWQFQQFPELRGTGYVAANYMSSVVELYGAPRSGQDGAKV